MYHLRAKIIGRGQGKARSAAGASAYRTGGRNAAAAAAYRAGEALRDPLTGRQFDYSRKAKLDAEGFGILHAEIMLPKTAPAWMADRQRLIDAVEAAEVRADAQLFREIEVSLPRELAVDQQIDLLRDFIRQEFIARGMIADMALHDERASDGGRNPHAHILLTLRRVGPDGFDKKERAWNSPDPLREWRTAWAELANDHLARCGHEPRLDARSHRARDIPFEPDSYAGPAPKRGFDGPLHAERQERRNAVKQANIDLLASDPDKLATAVSRERATFTARDMSAALRRATGLEPDEVLHSQLLAAAMASPDLVEISSDRRGAPRYATREMVEVEADMARAAHELANRRSVVIEAAPPEGLSEDQARAFRHVAYGADLVAISGVAGAGKTTTLAALGAAFAAAGHRVRGGALAGVAVRGLSEEANIPSTTLAAAFFGWDRLDRTGAPAPIAPLQGGDVFILDEAGLVGSRDMRRLVREVAAAEAKLVLVGDAQQLQAIEAGAAFRAIVDTHGACELRAVRRQQIDWQRQASELFARREAPAALAIYQNAGALRRSETSLEAMDDLVSAYLSDRGEGVSQLILAHTRPDIAVLNERVRAELRARGELGPDVQVTVRDQVRDEAGEIVERARHARFAVGDRVLFTRNDKGLDVQNGTTGAIDKISPDGALAVRTTDGRTVGLDIQAYPYLSLGYAMTVHKAQGATCDRTYYLASNRMDAHLGYVALTRHRHSAQVFYGEDQFSGYDRLVQAFARERRKDSTLDYQAVRPREGAEAVREPPSVATSPPQPFSGALSAAERIRQNVEKRRQNLDREVARDRSYGD